MKIWKALSIGLLCIFFLVVGELNSDTIHSLRYGNDRVSYRGRHYTDPNSATLKDLPIQGEELVPTGEKVIGLPVYDTRSSIQCKNDGNKTSTLLILKQSDDKFIVYSLSGGP